MMRKTTFRNNLLMVVNFLLLATFRVPSSVAQTPSIESLRTEIHFHARFDSGFDAKSNSGLVKIFTAESPARKEKKDGMSKPGVSIAKAQGKYGDCIRFSEKSKEVLCYPGTAMHYQDADWSGTTSFWMRLNPDEDLKPGYCDPIQITQKAWNDACFFVDFDIALPRDFRLGFFSALKHWNPENIPWEKWPVAKRPMVTVKQPPFSKANWTHVAFTYRNINSSKGLPAEATLYINGKPQGTLSHPMQVQWDLNQTAIMVGIDYIGDMDDLIVFRKALSSSEIQFLAELPAGL